MGIGILEIALLFIVTACVAVAVVMTKRRWLLGLPVYFVIATLCSPADPLSTVLIAVPCCLVYVFALLATSPANGPVVG